MYIYIVYCVKKGNLHQSHVLEDGLLEKDVVISQKNAQNMFCLSKKELKILETACPIHRLKGSWIRPKKVVCFRELFQD